MATNDDLDRFFKNKDRKANKAKKQTGLLTNNEELLKQLVIVTSATSAFKENMEFDDDEDEQIITNDSVIAPTDETHKTPIHHSKPKHPEQNKHTNEQYINLSNNSQQQQQQQQQQQPGQEDWEEFDNTNSKYAELRLKIAGGINDDDNDNDFYDEENNSNNNDNKHDSAVDREQQKDKPVWKIQEAKQAPESTAAAPAASPVVEEPPAPKSSTGAYRAPALRTGSTVTVVSGGNQRVTKKKEPNLASTDEFPTLGSTVNKK